MDCYSTSDSIPSGVNAGRCGICTLILEKVLVLPYYFTFGTDQDTGSGGTAEGQYYNREHSWPKSWFSDASPMYSDVVHVVPTDKYVNNTRSSYAYGEVGSADWTSNNGCKKGAPTSALVSAGCTESTVFEPTDVFKGDFARIYFYMCTRYWNVAESGPMTSSNFKLSTWMGT